MSKPTCRELLEIMPHGDGSKQADLAARVERVLALHKRVRGFEGWVCDSCIAADENLATWPCPTVRLLDGEGS